MDTQEPTVVLHLEKTNVQVFRPLGCLCEHVVEPFDKPTVPTVRDNFLEGVNFYNTIPNKGRLIGNKWLVQCNQPILTEKWLK